MKPPAPPRRAAGDGQATTLSVVLSIRRLIRMLRVTAQRTHARTGISAAQLFVLQQLGPGAGLSLNELAARTFTDRSSVAAVVDRLRESGLVNRAVDPADRRRAAVRITARGRRILESASDAPTTKLVAALKTLEPQQRATLAASLRRLTEALGAADHPAPMLFAEDAASVKRAAPRRQRGG